MALGAVGLIRWTAREAHEPLPRPYSANLRRAGLHDHTHAYALSRSAARKLLAFQRPVRLNVDTGIGRLVVRGELEAYVEPAEALPAARHDLVHRPGSSATNG